MASPPAYSLRVVSRAVAEPLLPMTTVIACVKEALVEYSTGHSDVPLRSHLSTDNPPGEMLVMPGYLPRMSALGVKIWSHFGTSWGPRTSAIIVYRDLERGEEFVVDGGVVTDTRTGALSAVAAEALAPADASTLALIGSGLQARSQLSALASILPLQEVRIWSRDPGRLRAFVGQARIDYPALHITAAPDASTCVRDAAVVVAATTSGDPVFDDRWLARDALVCGIGSHTPTQAEIPPASVARARWIAVDSRNGVLNGAGDIRIPLDSGLIANHSVIELGELVNGSRSGRNGEAGLAIFKSVGFAALDVAVARHVARAAADLGLGQEIEFH